MCINLIQIHKPKSKTISPQNGSGLMKFSSDNPKMNKKQLKARLLKKKLDQPQNIGLQYIGPWKEESDFIPLNLESDTDKYFREKEARRMMSMLIPLSKLVRSTEKVMDRRLSKDLPRKNIKLDQYLRHSPSSPDIGKYTCKRQNIEKINGAGESKDVSIDCREKRLSMRNQKSRIHDEFEANAMLRRRKSQILLPQLRQARKEIDVQRRIYLFLHKNEKIASTRIQIGKRKKYAIRTIIEEARK